MERSRFKYHGNSHSLTLEEGSEVCLRVSPVFSIGAKAIHVKGSQIQVHKPMLIGKSEQ